MIEIHKSWDDGKIMWQENSNEWAWSHENKENFETCASRYLLARNSPRWKWIWSNQSLHTRLVLVLQIWTDTWFMQFSNLIMPRSICKKCRSKVIWGTNFACESQSIEIEMGRKAPPGPILKVHRFLFECTLTLRSCPKWEKSRLQSHTKISNLYMWKLTS